MTSPVRQVRQLTAEVPDEVMAAALKIHADILGVKGECDGVSDAIRYAFNAGRESAFDGGQVEWGVQVAANRALAHRGLDEAEAREKLAYYQAIWGEKAWQVKRRLTAWEDVPDA